MFSEKQHFRIKVYELSGIKLRECVRSELINGRVRTSLETRDISYFNISLAEKSDSYIMKQKDQQKMMTVEIGRSSPYEQLE